MRILHVIATLAAEEGGPSRAVLDLSLAAAKRGHEVSILTTDYGGSPVESASARGLGVSIESFPVSVPRRWKRSPLLRRALERAIPRADVVHLHSLYLYHCMVTAGLCRRHAIPYIIRPHGTLDPFMFKHHRWRKYLVERLFQNRVTDNAAGLHFTTREEQELARPYSRGKRGFVVPLPFDGAEFADLPPAQRFRDRFPETAERRILLFMSRLNFKKGLDILIAAFGRLAVGHQDLHLVVAGPDDGMRAAVEGWIAAAGLQRRVSLTGMLRGEDRLAALSAAEIAVLPSYSENFGFSVVEAMASGIPVVISDKVNIWREVEAAGAGLVCRADEQDLAEKLSRLIGETEAARRRGRNGTALVARAYSHAAVGQRIEEMYEGVLSDRVAVKGAA